MGLAGCTDQSSALLGPPIQHPNAQIQTKIIDERNKLARVLKADTSAFLKRSASLEYAKLLHSYELCEEAHSLYTQIRWGDSRDSEIYHLIADCLIKTKRPERAVDALESALQINSGQTISALNLAKIHLQTQSITAAEKALKSACISNSQTPEACFLLAELRFSASKDTPALDSMRQIYQQHPNTKNLAQALQQALIRANHTDEAENLANHIQKLGEHADRIFTADTIMKSVYVKREDEWFWNFMSRKAIDKNDLITAEHYLKRLSKIKPNDLKAQHNYWVVLVKLGRHQLADQQRTYISETFPNAAALPQSKLITD